MNTADRSQNLLGQAQRSKIQRQLLSLLLLSTVVPVAIVGTYGATAFNRSLARSLLQDFEEDAVAEANVLADLVEDAKVDVEFLDNSFLLQGYVESRVSGGSVRGLNAEAWKGQFVGDITVLLNAHPEYSQVRYIDEKGQELVRVVNSEDPNGTAKVLTEAALKKSSSEPYLQEMLGLKKGEVYVTRPDAAGEEGLVKGRQIHFGAGVFDPSGNNRGVLIIDVPVEELVQRLDKAAEAEVGSFEGEQHYILDSDGGYVGDSLPEFLGDSFADDHTSPVVDGVLNDPTCVVDSAGELVAHHRIDPNPEQANEHLHVVKILPRKQVYGPATTFRNVALLVSLLSLAVVLPLGILRGRKLVGLLERLINGISTSSQQIFSTVSEQERIASQQAASVSETSTTMEELEASSRQSAEQALAAVDAAKTALDRAEIGSKAVNETLAGMFTLEQKVDAIAQQIVNLSAQAGEIGSISQTVSDFASQTNMLALNSSVEAVRAGEHGKGFAVVANEIRKLSEQSQQSADRINALVADIQKLINQTVMVTEEGTKTAKSGVKVAKLTEQACDDIKRSVDAVVVNNQQVSLNQKQQVDAIRQVVLAMESIDRSSKESATGLSQTRTGTEQLNEAARSLREMM